MKKVALIHYRLVQKGGLESRLINYMNYFSEHGYQVTVFATKKDPKLQLPPNVSYQRVNIGPIPKFFRQLFFAKKIRKVVQPEQYDFCLSLGRTFCKSTIIDGGNHIGYMDSLGYSKKGVKDKLNIHLDRVAFSEAKNVFACSEFVRSYNLSGFNTAEEKIKIAHPPINPDQFNQKLRSNRSTYREEFELKDEVTTFLFVSTGHKMKNLKFLIEIFEALEGQPYELVIAGTPPKMRLPSNVKFLGYVKQPERLYTAVDCTIHPALYEPYGQIVAESIQCGTPVMLSKNVGAKAVVTEKEGIIIDSFSLAEWTREIQEFKNKTFDISPTFAVDNSLTLDQHMQRIMS